MADHHSAHLPPQAGRHGEPTSQVTACHRCRKQKLRCSRETPSCKRCLDISTVCTYPPPPDRKLLAAQRAQNAKTRSLRESGMAGDQRDHSGKPAALSERQSPSEQDGSQSFRQSNRSDHGRDQMPEDAPSSGLGSAAASFLQVTFPSKELASSLIEIFFSHMWSATLLFHKETLISNYFSGNTPDYIALSVFALGSVYLHEIAGPNVEYNPAHPGSRYPGEDWARAASQQVLMNCDQPRHETVQACQILALYWYAVNQTDKTNIHHYLAYRTCRLLGYHALGAHEPGVDDFYVELKRRAFWVTWCMSCLSQHNATFKSESWKECVGLPFPSDEPSFSSCQPVVKEAFDADGHLVLVDEERPEHGRMSYLGEMVKLLGLWWEIQRFTRKYVDAGPLDSLKRMSQLQELDQQLEQVRDNLNPEFQYVDQSSFASRDINHSYQLFTIHMTYHTCVCVLHSSIVPLFSNIPPDPRISKKLTRLSAEEAVKHSQKLVNMATQLLGIYPDKARCPAFSGYAMFVASSVQFKSLGAQGLLRNDTISHLYPAISIVEFVKRIWRPAELLWVTLDTLFKGAGMNIHRLSDTRQLLARPESNTDIDQIAAHGVVAGSTDMYTYIPDQEPASESSRHSSASLSAAGSPAPQHTTAQRQHSSGSVQASEAIPRTINTSAPVTMPIHTRPTPQQMYWSGQQPPPYDVGRRGTVPRHQESSIGAPLEFMPMNQSSEIMQSTEQNFPSQISSMGYIDTSSGMNLSMGIESMDLDASNASLWWDQPFEDIPVDHYGMWFTEGYQSQGYPVPNLHGFYQS